MTSNINTTPKQGFSINTTKFKVIIMVLLTTLISITVVLGLQFSKNKKSQNNNNTKIPIIESSGSPNTEPKGITPPENYETNKPNSEIDQDEIIVDSLNPDTSSPNKDPQTTENKKLTNRENGSVARHLKANEPHANKDPQSTEHIKQIDTNPTPMTDLNNDGGNNKPEQDQSKIQIASSNSQTLLKEDDKKEGSNDVDDKYRKESDNKISTMNPSPVLGNEKDNTNTQNQTESKEDPKEIQKQKINEYTALTDTKEFLNTKEWNDSSKTKLTTEIDKYITGLKTSPYDEFTTLDLSKNIFNRLINHYIESMLLKYQKYFINITQAPMDDNIPPEYKWEIHEKCETIQIMEGSLKVPRPNKIDIVELKISDLKKEYNFLNGRKTMILKHRKTIENTELNESSENIKIESQNLLNLLKESVQELETNGKNNLFRFTVETKDGDIVSLTKNDILPNIFRYKSTEDFHKQVIQILRNNAVIQSEDSLIEVLKKGEKINLELDNLNNSISDKNESSQEFNKLLEQYETGLKNEIENVKPLGELLRKIEIIKVNDSTQPIDLTTIREKIKHFKEMSNLINLKNGGSGDFIIPEETRENCKQKINDIIKKYEVEESKIKLPKLFEELTNKVPGIIDKTASLFNIIIKNDVVTEKRNRETILAILKDYQQLLIQKYIDKKEAIELNKVKYEEVKDEEEEEKEEVQEEVKDKEVQEEEVKEEGKTKEEEGKIKEGKEKGKKKEKNSNKKKKRK